MNRSKPFRIVFAAAMLLILLSGTAYAQNGAIVREGSTYWIEDANDFAAFPAHAAYNRAATYSIRANADIDMTGKTFTPVKNFSGTFNGNNVDIKNLVITAKTGNLRTGIFETTTGATIKNIKLSNVTVTGYIPPTDDLWTYSAIGIIAAFSNGSKINNIEIEGFNVTGFRNASAVVGYSNNTTFSKITLLPYANGSNSLLAGQNNVGGIVGSCGVTGTNSYDLIQDITIKNISVIGKNNTGGIVGIIADSDIKRVVIEGITSASTGIDVGAGAGQAISTTFSDITIRNSVVSSDSGNVQNYGILIGVAPGTDKRASSIKNCNVYDCELNAPNCFAAGGLVGQFVASNKTTMGDISNSHVKNTSIVSRGPTGGFIGTAGKIYVSGCSVENNETQIISKYDSPLPTYSAGGFVGEILANSNVINCWVNTTVISNNYMASGFVGGINTPHPNNEIDKIVFENCSAYGTVDTSGYYVGGFLGRTSFGNYGIIKNCSSAVQVLNGTNASGGFAGMTGTQIYNSYSTGNVISDADYAGGFVGEINNTIVSNCYSTGDVEAFKAGGFVGLMNNSKVNHVYSTGKISGLLSAGGLIGETKNHNEITDSMALGPFVRSGETADCFYGSKANGGSLKIQDVYVWNGIRVQDRKIENKAGDAVTFIKSYNVWDAFGSTANPKSIPAWSGWDETVWKNNPYDTANEFLLPILDWQTETIDADASHLLYLTEIGINPVKLTFKDKVNEAKFQIDLDALEVEYSHEYYNNWKWNSYLTFGDNEDGYENIPTPVLVKGDIKSNMIPFETEKQSTTELNPYAWGIVGLSEPGRNWFIDERINFYKTATYFKNDGGTESVDSLFVNGGLTQTKTKTELNWENNGLILARWNNLPDGTGNINYAPNQKIGPLTDDFELYAQWEKAPENGNSKTNPGKSKSDSPGSSIGNEEPTPQIGFETKLPPVAAIIVLLFSIAIAVFVFVYRKEEMNE